MPFSRHNLRFTTLLIGIIVLVGVSVFGVVLISRTPHPEPTLYAAVTGFPSVIIMHLLQMLKQQVETREAVHDLRGDMQHTTTAVQESAETMVQASKEVAKATNGDLDKRIKAGAEAAIEAAIPRLVEACRCQCSEKFREGNQP